MSALWREARRAARDNGDYQALIALVPYARFLGIEFAAGSKPHLRLPFRQDLVGNPNPAAWHGGVTAAFMESAALIQLLLHLDEQRMPKSIDFAIDYLRSGQPQALHADCQIARVGSRVAQVSVRCWQDAEEQPIALARGHFLLSPTSAGETD